MLGFWGVSLLFFFKGSTQNWTKGSLLGMSLGNPNAPHRKDKPKAPGQAAGCPHLRVLAGWRDAAASQAGGGRKQLPAQVCPGASGPHFSLLHPWIPPAEFPSCFLRAPGCSG